GICTRLTATGVQDEADRCTRTATCALASGVSATSPSIPAVLRPALRCVTCRTLTSVLARLRSISFCRFLTLGQSCSCDALKIRCRSRRTCPSLETPPPPPPYLPLLLPPVDLAPFSGCVSFPGPALRSVHLRGRRDLG